MLICVCQLKPLLWPGSLPAIVFLHQMHFIPTSFPWKQISMGESRHGRLQKKIFFFSFSNIDPFTKVCQLWHLQYSLGNFFPRTELFIYVHLSVHFLSQQFKLFGFMIWREAPREHFPTLKTLDKGKLMFLGFCFRVCRQL